MKTATELKQDIVFDAMLRGQSLRFHSTWGLFSPRSVDDGTQLLIEHVKIKEGQTTLDLGCGYGAIGLAIAKAFPSGMVHMVDKDFVAVDFATKNAAANGLANCKIYLSNAFSEVFGNYTKLKQGREHTVTVAVR